MGMLISWVVLIVALAGLLLWLLSSNPRVSEVGKVMFFCGLLVTCLVLGGKTVRVG